MPTPLNLETVVTPSVIANLGLIQLNTTNDTTDVNFCKCNLCHTGIMYVYPDVETGGSRFYCNNCQWAGTTIQLYQELRNIPNINTAWQLLSSETDLSLPRDMAVDTLDYYSNYRYKLDIVNICRSKWKWHLTKNLPTSVISFLEKHDLWVGDTTLTTNSPLGKYIGCLTWSNYIDLIKCSYSLNAFKDKQFKYKDAIVLEYETVPGQLAAVLLIDRFGRTELRSVLQNRRQLGVMGMRETVDHVGSELIVVDDPLLYLELVKKWYTYSNQKSGIVCVPSSDSLDGSLRLLHAMNTNKKFICVGKGVTSNALNIARSFEDLGKYYFLQNPSDVTTNNIVTVLNKIKNEAEDWPAALKNLSKVSTPQEFAVAIKTKLTKEEVEKIKATCSRQEWLEIEHHFSNVNNVVTFEVDNNVYIYRPNKGVYKLNKHIKPNVPQEQLVCDAYVNFETLCYVNDNTYITGNIKGTGYTINFIDELSEVKNNFDEWLVNKTVREGNLVTVANNYRKKLFDIFFKQSKIQIAKTLDKVGWDKQKECWQFVKFLITGDGEIKPCKEFAAIKTPLSNLQPTKPSRLLLEKWFKLTPVNALVVNLLKVVISNLLADKDSTGSYSAGLINYNDDIYNVLQEFGERLNLNKYSQRTHLKTTHVAKIAHVEKQHPLPLMLLKETFLHPTWVDWLRYHSPHNVITTVTNKEIVNVDTGTNWVTLNSNKVILHNFEKEFSEIETIIPYLLCYVLKNKITKPATVTQLDFVTDVINTAFGELVPEIITFNKYCSGHVHELPKDAWSRFILQLICAESLNELNLPKIDDDVVINWRAVSSKLSRLNYDVLLLEQLENVNELTRKIDGGWIIPANVYEAYKKLFKQIVFTHH